MLSWESRVTFLSFFPHFLVWTILQEAQQGRRNTKQTGFSGEDEAGIQTLKVSLPLLPGSQRLATYVEFWPLLSASDRKKIATQHVWKPQVLHIHPGSAARWVVGATTHWGALNTCAIPILLPISRGPPCVKEAGKRHIIYGYCL